MRALILLLALSVFRALAQEPEAVANIRYRLQPGDTLDVIYRLTPEFNQTVTIQPDGFVLLTVAGEMKVGGLVIGEACDQIAARSGIRLKDPEVAISLKDFERPHFTVVGEVQKPGKFDLRSATTAMEAIAVAGGIKDTSKHSQVLVIRRIGSDWGEVHEVDVKRLMRGETAEDLRIRPGDLIVVPKNLISKVERLVRWGSIGVFWNPLPR